MHPRYNTNGGKRKPSKSKRLAKARQEHEEYLTSLGITSRKKLKGAIVLDDPTTPSPRKTVATSGKIPGSGRVAFDVAMMKHKGVESENTIAEIEAKGRRVAPAYNKGGYQYVSDPASLKNNGRRDR